MEPSQRGVRRHHLRGVRRRSGHHLGPRGWKRRARVRPRRSQELRQPEAGGLARPKARHPGGVRRRPHAVPDQAVRRGGPAGVGAARGRPNTRRARWQEAHQRRAQEGSPGCQKREKVMTGLS